MKPGISRRDFLIASGAAIALAHAGAPEANADVFHCTIKLRDGGSGKVDITIDPESYMEMHVQNDQDVQWDVYNINVRDDPDELMVHLDEFVVLGTTTKKDPFVNPLPKAIKVGAPLGEPKHGKFKLKKRAVQGQYKYAVRVVRGRFNQVGYKDPELDVVEVL
jgi:hypothetical protein